MASHADVHASLPLQMSLYFGGFYAAALFVLTLLMYIYKAVMLPYPPNAIGLEVAFVFVYAGLEWARTRLGAREGGRAARGGRAAAGGVARAAR